MTALNNSSMLATVQIAGVDVRPIAYKGEPVVTFEMVDAIHQRAKGTAGRNFRENRERFVEGEDFVALDQPDEIRRHGYRSNQRKIPFVDFIERNFALSDWH